jgi:hypothetical protein
MEEQMSKLGRGFKCADCLTSTIDEYYMVTDEVWFLAWSGWRCPRPPETGLDHMLCIRCLERRIGRTLTCVDFTKYPVNDLNDPKCGGWSRSERLLDRLSRGRETRP